MIKLVVKAYNQLGELICSGVKKEYTDSETAVSEFKRAVSSIRHLDLYGMKDFRFKLEKKDGHYNRCSFSWKHRGIRQFMSLHGLS